MEPATACGKSASHPLPLPLFLVRARSRATRVAAAACPGTPPRRSPVTVPFLWEEAPGKPKAPPPEAAAPVLPEADQDKGHAEAEAEGRPVPLKLPPRLQHVPSSSAAPDASLSPKTVLQGPYYGCKRPWTGSGVAAFRFRRTPSAGVGLFSRTRSKPAPAAAGPDAPWCSPAASSASSSSSASASCFGDDHGHGGHRRPGDGYSEEDEDSAATGSVRITRFSRNRSLPTMTTSHLWASIRRSVKQIAPWS